MLERLTSPFKSPSKATDYQAMAKPSAPPVWSSGTFDCCADSGICCSVVFCGPITTAQLYAKFVAARQGVCVIAAVLLWIAALASFAQSADGDEKDTELPFQWTAGVMALLGAIAGVAGIFTCITTCLAKRALRARDGIVEEGCWTECAGVEDCLCASFCAACTQCMLLRHDLGTKKYTICEELPV
mgnify:CR=1 FL=1|tara:strand:+ start:1078 stop:1635 length:558 start_codon:yes stop_codon:yes gene_type:complete